MKRTVPTTIPLEQKLSLIKLKNRVADEHGVQETEDEYRLMRFLRARNFDVDKAYAMVRNHLEWKKQFNIDEIHNYQGPEVLKRHFPRSPRYLDKDGDIALYFSFGTLDIRGMLKSSKKLEILQRAFHDLQSDVLFMEELSENNDKVHEQWSYMIDIEHISLTQVTLKEAIELYLIFIKYYEANYAERLKRAFVLNASNYFYIVYSIVKPLLSPATVDKIKIFGKDGYKEELKKFFDPEQLPAFLGGNITDPDGNPRCTTTICFGGVIPESYYNNNAKHHLVGEPGVKKFTVSRMSKVTIDIDVTEPGSCIQWQFETMNRDIAFGLKFQKSKKHKESTEIVKLQRVHTWMFSEEGMYQCQESGIYSLVFDNAFSWLRSKELYCRVSLTLPNGQKTYITE